MVPRPQAREAPQSEYCVLFVSVEPPSRWCAPDTLDLLTPARPGDVRLDAGTSPTRSRHVSFAILDRERCCRGSSERADFRGIFGNAAVACLVAVHLR